MATLTAVELGPDTCALARTSVRRGEIHVSAVETLDPASFPGIGALTTALGQCRRALKLPRRCRVVLWGLPEGANRKDAAVKPLLLPLSDAGFRVERVVSPCNALAALARLKASRREGATCWVAINRAGVAIVVVRPGKQLYAHSFVWDSTIGSLGSQARLLQRYSLVSYLSPEVKRAMADARRQGTPVDVVVTCGNLADLRSLTMPLIEELDVEVETLDSLDGLVVSAAVTERLAEAAPAIRLACAGAIARGARPWDESKRRSAQRTGALVRVAAVVAIVAVGAIGFSSYERWRASGAVAPIPATRNAPAALPPPSVTPKPRPEPLPSTPEPMPQTTAPAPPTGAKAPVSPPVHSGVNRVPVRTDKPERSEPPLLEDPVPRLTAILMSNDRRFATVNDGRVVGVGDALGRRVVVAIDERALVLREPSGVQIRVGLGGKVLGVERGR